MFTSIEPIEIAVDALDKHLYFPPLSRQIRGTVDFRRIADRDPGALQMSRDWGTVPGEVLGIDREGKVYVREPLHDAGHKRLKERIERAGMRLQDEVTTFDAADLARVLWTIKRAVDGGIATILKGRLPETMPEDPDKRVATDPRDDQINTLVSSVTKLADTVEKLVAKHGV